MERLLVLTLMRTVEPAHAPQVSYSGASARFVNVDKFMQLRENLINNLVLIWLIALIVKFEFLSLYPLCTIEFFLLWVIKLHRVTVKELVIISLLIPTGNVNFIIFFVRCNWVKFSQEILLWVEFLYECVAFNLSVGQILERLDFLKWKFLRLPWKRSRSLPGWRLRTRGVESFRFWIVALSFLLSNYWFQL